MTDDDFEIIHKRIVQRSLEDFEKKFSPVLKKVHDDLIVFGVSILRTKEDGSFEAINPLEFSKETHE